MIYIILIIGIILIIYGAIGSLRDGQSRSVSDYRPAEPHSFDDLLSSRLIIQRLDGIEEKIDRLHDEYAKIRPKTIESINEVNDTQINLRKQVFDDLNRQIYIMKSEGMDIEEISNKLGILKGEVLLRLGMKK